MKYFLFVAAMFVSIFSFAQQKANYKVGLIGFYNLENFFDTIDDPKIEDEEFLPGGAKHYTSANYQDKLTKLSTVLSQIGTDLSPDGLSIIGDAEVENEGVMHDLVNQPTLKARNYQIIHYESPDERGIDVCMLYNPKYFKPISSEPLYVHLGTDTTEHKTRDVLFVYGKFDGEDLYVFVNHWPSRRGGEEASAPLRAKAAAVCRHKVDSIFAINKNAKIVVMGDLNDDPVSPSVVKVLKAETVREKVREGELFNPFAAYFKQGIGTLGYNDAWNLFDQIMVSSGFLNKDQNGYFFREALIFKKPWMLETEGQYKGYPKRTYNFDNYQGGYSDHLPTYIVLLKKS